MVNLGIYLAVKQESVSCFRVYIGDSHILSLLLLPLY